MILRQPKVAQPSSTLFWICGQNPQHLVLIAAQIEPIT